MLLRVNQVILTRVLTIAAWRIEHPGKLLVIDRRLLKVTLILRDRRLEGWLGWLFDHQSLGLLHWLVSDSLYRFLKIVLVVAAQSLVQNAFEVRTDILDFFLPLR